MQLVKYEAACQALAECRRIDEVKGWADKAAALAAYARQCKDNSLLVDAGEIQARAKRRMGELLMEMEKPKGGRPIEKPLRAVEGFSVEEPATLKSIGITYNQSAEAQAIARIPAEQFEQTLAEHREEQKAVTGRMMAKLTKQAAEIVPPKPDEARLYEDLMTAWDRATPAVRGRFVEAVSLRFDEVATPATPTTTAWAAYAMAYHERYHVEPVRNATVNGQLAQLVKRIGAFDAPHVARHYVQSNAAFYVKCGHSVGQLLKDAEKLRTEWATNTRMTETRARQVDRTEAGGQVWAELIQEAQAREATR